MDCAAVGACDMRTVLSVSLRNMLCAIAITGCAFGWYVSRSAKERAILDLKGRLRSLEAENKVLEEQIREDGRVVTEILNVVGGH